MQTEHGQLEASLFEKRAALEDKYQKLYLPLYTKRFEFVNGVEVDGPVTQASLADQDEDEEAVEKGVPDFWLTAMKNNEVLAEEFRLVSEMNSRIENAKGFELEFFFETNPYFKNAVLTKTYHIIDEDEPILEKAFGTEIEWYPVICYAQDERRTIATDGQQGERPLECKQQ
ncbi:hypothetical protein RND71_042400 [Anisodus tanguticus]|uniref:Uncharacterized protein n=1 Tax=Anisodus tanguticus TaxID=243964 RepID=A0AAE1UMZ1_9SOLA|nr:hypothetical protein RND71_042400 [Anisodus tanguticus]